MAKKQPVHGGAWKVAYADFVTAMMALFMVLWISAQDHQILLATSNYFKQPFNAMTDKSVGVMQGKDGGSKGKDKARDTSTAANLAFLNALASELQRMLNVHDASQESPVDVEVTSDGLKITIYDRNKQPLFLPGSSDFTDWGKFVMQNLAWSVDRNDLNVFVDGHSAKGQKPRDKAYGLWELTSDRANAARRMLEFYAVNPQKIERVSGYGDTRPLATMPPESDSNSRITVSLSLNKKPTEIMK